MSFAVKSDVRFNAGEGEATWVLRAETFSGLDIADRQEVRDRGADQGHASILVQAAVNSPSAGVS